MDQDLAHWVVRAQEGDRGAFTVLVEKHRGVAAGVAMGIVGETHLAADAVQEAFFKAYQALDQLKDPERFVPWFLAIVRSCATDLVRRQTRWGTRETSYGDGVGETESRGFGSSPSSGPEESLTRRETSGQIQEAMAALPEDYREVILLKHLEGRSYREIARLLKTSVRSVESKLFRARQQLSGQLQRLRAREESSPPPEAKPLPEAAPSKESANIDQTAGRPASVKRKAQ